MKLNVTLSNVANLIPYLLWWSFDLLPLQRGSARGNVISADLFLTWLTVMRIKCTCKHNLEGGGLQKKHTTGAKGPAMQAESLCTDIKKRHKRYKSKLDTWGQSDTSVSSYNLHPPPPPLLLFSSNPYTLISSTRLSLLPSNTLHILFPFLLFSACHLPSHSRCTSPTPPNSAKCSWHKSTSMW